MKKTSKAPYIFMAIFAYVILFIFTCHIGHVYDSETMTIIDAIPLAFDAMEKSPFDISPINFKGILGMTGIYGFVMLCMKFNADEKKKLKPNKEYGSAKWNNNIKAYNKKFNYPYGKDKGGEKNNLILSQDVQLGLDNKKTMRNSNQIILGGSGSGKTFFVCKPNILSANCNYVVTDPNGAILESVGDFLRSEGYTIKVFNLVDKEHSCSYNPFHYIRDEVGVLSMIDSLVNNTTPKGASKGDPFWEKSEKALISAICFYLYYACEEEDRNFANVMELVRAAEVKDNDPDYKSVLDELMDMLRETDPDNIALKQYAVFKQAAPATATSILISVSSRLNNFNVSAIANLTSTDTINFETLASEKTALFCITPLKDKTFNFLVALLYTQLLDTLYHIGDMQTGNTFLPYHIQFILDEFANIGEIPDFENTMATCRQYNIGCTVILQNMAQLKQMYKDSYESITGNADSFVFLGGQEQSTLEYVSKKLGKETIKAKNTSSSKGRSGSSSVSYNKMGRELLTADELSVMKNEDCVVFIRGIHPFFTKKYMCKNHPNFKKSGDADKSKIFKIQDNFETPIREKFGETDEFKILEEEVRENINNIPKTDEIEKDNELRKETINGLSTYQETPVDTNMIKEIGIKKASEIEDFIEIEEAYNPDEDFEMDIDFEDSCLF